MGAGNSQGALELQGEQGMGQEEGVMEEDTADAE